MSRWFLTGARPGHCSESRTLLGMVAARTDWSLRYGVAILTSPRNGQSGHPIPLPLSIHDGRHGRQHETRGCRGGVPRRQRQSGGCLLSSGIWAGLPSPRILTPSGSAAPAWATYRSSWICAISIPSAIQTLMSGLAFAAPRSSEPSSRPLFRGNSSLRLCLRPRSVPSTRLLRVFDPWERGARAPFS
jgi:hypothetical protein